jgi:hypothetical protein
MSRLSVIVSTSRVGELDGDAAQAVDQAGEADEIDLHVAVDGDVEAVCDRVDEPGGATPQVCVVGRVDLGAAVGARDGQVQVTGDRQHLRLAALEVQQHHRVGPLPAGGLGAVEAGVALALDVGTRVGAHDQVVGAAAGRRERLADLDAVDAVEDAAGVEVAAHQADNQQDDERDDDPTPAEPGPRPLRRGRGARGVAAEGRSR